VNLVGASNFSFTIDPVGFPVDEEPRF
jgi:hypothetical protein